MMQEINNGRKQTTFKKLNKNQLNEINTKATIGEVVPKAEKRNNTNKRFEVVTILAIVSNSILMQIKCNYGHLYLRSTSSYYFFTTA